jgi:DNA-binding transcriptional ArsR family regulator
MNIGSDVLSPATLQPAALPSPVDVAGAADVFGLLADPGRLRILLVLRDGAANVGELSQRCGLSESATSHALRLLRAHQVVQVRRIGRLAYYRLADAHVADLLGIAIAHIEHTSQDGTR